MLAVKKYMLKMMIVYLHDFLKLGLVIDSFVMCFPLYEIRLVK